MRIPRKHGFLAAALVTAAALLSGCASLGTGGTDANTLLASLYPVAGGVGTLRGEAEITVSLSGRSVSMPGALLLGPSGTFRIDLLDPLDRPAAIIFTEGKRIVQYRPAGGEAASLAALPDVCRSVTPGGWVPFALGNRPSRDGEGKFETVRWFGGDSLVKYEWGTVAVRIEYRREDGGGSPSSVSWYCGDEVAMRLRYGKSEGGEGGVPRGFTVEYPLARLKVEVRLGEHETGVSLSEGFFRPRLPAGTRWVGWDLVGGGKRGLE